MSGKERILKILEKRKDEIRDKYKVKEMWIFGSFVRGQQKKTSDVDILVDFEEVPDLFDFLELERYLEKILNVKVDLLRKQAIRRELKQRILNEAIAL